MKKTIFLSLLLLALVACNQNNPQQPDKPVVEDDDQDTTSVTGVLLTYDSVTNCVTAVPSDSISDYVLFVWMVQDYIADYGNDFSDDHIFESMESYIQMSIQYQMSFPIFQGSTTVEVYEYFDQPYPGEDYIAMAAAFDVEKNELIKPVSYLFFTTPQ